MMMQDFVLEVTDPDAPMVRCLQSIWLSFLSFFLMIFLQLMKNITFFFFAQSVAKKKYNQLPKKLFPISGTFSWFFQGTLGIFLRPRGRIVPDISDVTCISSTERTETVLFPINAPGAHSGIYLLEDEAISISQGMKSATHLLSIPASSSSGS